MSHSGTPGGAIDEPATTASAAQGSTGSLPEGLAEALDHLGRLRWDQYMELALYAPASGFFATSRGAGRRGGDFITSPEVGPTFGMVLAAHLDRLWDRLGAPVPFTVIECGAGRGALAIAVRAASPRCAAALHWTMVERSASLRAEQGDHLDLVEYSAVTDAENDAKAAGVSESGPWFSSLADMPAGALTGAVIANELLDNLPFRLLEQRDGTWQEVMVALGEDPAMVGRDAGGEPGGEPGHGTGRIVGGSDEARPLVEELAPVPAVVVEAFDEVVPDAREGSRVPWQQAAGRWVSAAIEVLERGEVIVFDYAESTRSLAQRPHVEWLRTYRSHARGSGPLEDPGSQDITVEVALDQLPRYDGITTQAEWLRDNGLDALVADAEGRWRERAGIGDLEAIRARSVATEAAALVDPAGLGAFKVLTWRVGDPVPEDRVGDP